MLTSTPCIDIAPAAIDWLWQPYIARGKLCILDGDPGTGKSFVALDLAARLSRGDALPDGQPLARPHVTLLLSAEDDAADTIRPRLSAAGANLSRVHVVAALGMNQPALPQFPADLPALGDVIRERRADLVVIDPLLPFFPREVWANNDQSVRKALTPLASLAAETNCAILFIRHLTKAGGAKAIYRGSGSIGIVGAVRTALLLASHPDDETLKVLATTKTNVGTPGRSLGFRLTTHPTGETVVTWTEALDLTANDLCTRVEHVRPRERAKDWLRDQLANGKRRASEIEAAAKQAGIADKTLRRAKEALSIIAEQIYTDGQQEWWWHDPATSKPKAAWTSILPPLEDLL